MKLGAGRATKEDKIDFASGIILNKKVGDHVEVGDTLCVLHTNIDNFNDIMKEAELAFKLSSDPIKVLPIIHEIVQ